MPALVAGIHSFGTSSKADDSSGLPDLGIIERRKSV
jgi:hypothetical protein